MQFSRPQKCSVCNRMFQVPQDLITHFNIVHLHNPQFPTSSNVSVLVPAPAPANFRHNPYRNPGPGVPARSRFDLTYYRRGYLDNLGRFQRGIPPAAAVAATPARAVTPPERSKFLFEQEEEEKPKLMDFFPGETSSSSSSENGSDPALPLLCQLEQQYKPPEDTVVMENVEAIDLTLRL